MPVVENTTLGKLSEFLTPETLPFADYVPAGTESSLLNRLYYTHASVGFDGVNLVVDLTLAFKGAITLRIPGCETFHLAFGDGASSQWTGVDAALVVGPDLSLRLSDLEMHLVIDRDVLSDKYSGQDAKISFTGDVLFTPHGVFMNNASGGTLPPSVVGATGIEVTAQQVRVHFADPDAPEGADFTGVTLETLSVTLPTEYVGTDNGVPVTFEAERLSIGSAGITGDLSFEGPFPVATFLGFPCRFRSFRAMLVESAVVELSAGIDINIEKLKAGLWIGVDASFHENGGIAVALSAEQPPEAASDTNAAINITFADAADISFRSLHVERKGAAGSKWSVVLNGDLALLADGMGNWPSLPIDRLGITSDGEISLPEAAGMVLPRPLVVDWHFSRLTIPKIRFGRVPDLPDAWRLALDASVVVCEGVSAGFSVQGLSIDWPTNGNGTKVSFDGIGIELEVPGSFRAALSISYKESANGHEFLGRGRLALTALDVAIDVTVATGRLDGVLFLYLFADAQLVPQGIPIGATGLTLYGIQGLVANNMTLDVTGSDPERYYRLYAKAQPTVGIQGREKFRVAKDNAVIGLGVIIGTSDQGFLFNVQGLLVVTLPDLTILLQCRAKFISERPRMPSTQGPIDGALDALLVYDGANEALSFDITGQWGQPKLFDVDGHARAYFSFRDPNAWYVKIGQKGGPLVTVRALQFGNQWWFAAGFWFEMNRSTVETGLVWDLSVRYEGGSFFIGVNAGFQAEMALLWSPPQWRTNAKGFAHISAGYKGLSIGLSVEIGMKLAVARPFSATMSASACFRAFRWRACVGHTFRWQNNDLPELPDPVRLITAAPTHWTPVAGQKGGESINLADGVELQPHSVIHIDFSKPTTDISKSFSERLQSPVPQLIDGFGNVEFGLERVSLTRTTGPSIPAAVQLWGAWDQHKPGTVLRLFSSDRFAHGGSLSERFVDAIDLTYCGEPPRQNDCVPLTDIQPGYGLLQDGTRYFWQVSQGTSGRENSPYLKLAQGDTLTIYADASWLDVRLVAKGAESSTVEIPQLHRPIVIAGNGDGPAFLRICRSIPASPGQTEVRYGSIVTTSEEWSMPEDATFLQPGETYQFELVTRPATAAFAQPCTFTVAAPPAYAGALEHYIVSRYPSDGARPVYLGYDMSVTFVKPYVPAMYEAADLKLAIRLLDHEQHPVTDAEGNPVLIPMRSASAVTINRAREVWEATYDRDRNCLKGLYVAPPTEEANTISLPSTTVALTPGSHYTAEIVTVDAGQPGAHALASWSFTTSLYATFKDMMNLPWRITAPIVARAAIAGDFDECARLLGLPTVRQVATMVCTPILSVGADKCVALAIDAPEPLDASLRLSATIDGVPGSVVANADETRVIVLAETVIGAAGDVLLALEWRRDPGLGNALTRKVNGNSTSERFDIRVGCGVRP